MPGEPFEASFLDLLAQEIRRDPLAPRVVLVGSNYLGLHLRHTLAERTGGHVGTRFVTFVDLAETLNRPDIISSGRVPFPPDAEELLLAALADGIDSESSFYEVRNRHGFHRALRASFHDLIDGGLTELPPITSKLKELSALFATHRKGYLSRFYSTADGILEATKTAGRFRTVFEAESLYVYGFYDFTEAQRRLLDACKKFLTIHDFSPPTEGWPFPKDVRLFSASWDYAESEEIVRRLLALHEAAPFPLHRAAILLHDADLYLSSVSEILTRAGVPHYREGGRPLHETRIGRALHTLIEFLDRPGSRAELIELLTLFPYKEEHLTDCGTSADWDRWTRQARVTSHTNLFARMERRSDLPVSGFLKFAKGWLNDIEKIRRSSSGWTSFATELERFLLHYVPDGPDTDAALLVIRSLRELETLNVPGEAEVIRTTLLQRLERQRVTDAVFERDGLFLGTMASARAIPFDVVFVPGLLERLFPGPPRPDPLLLDSERERLNRQFGCAISLKGNRPTEDTALFEMICRQARKSLILSYPRFDLATAKERLPSVFFERAERHSARPAEIVPLARWHREEKEGGALDRSDWLASHVAHDVSTGRLPRGLAEWAPLTEPVRRWVEARLGRSQWTSYDGRLDKKLDPPPAYSASQIETYVTCPHRYFLRHIVGLRPSEDPDAAEQIDPKDRGTLVHDILFQLFSKLRDEGRFPFRPSDRESVQERLRTIAESVFRGAEMTFPVGHRVVWETDKRFILHDLEAILALEFDSTSPFVPEAFEVAFGSEEHPVQFEIGKESVALRGQIDRIDLSPDRRRARVIDYKSGTIEKCKAERFSKGRKVQLAVYLAALPALYPGLDPQDSEAYLLATSSLHAFERVSFSGKTFVGRRQEFRQILETVHRGVTGGFFPPTPGSGRTNCRLCDFKNVCGPGIQRVYERKAEDTALLPLRELEEIE